MSFLAIDQGTTSTRAITYDARGDQVQLARRELTPHFPAAGDGSWVEHCPLQIWDDVAAVVAELDTSKVRAIGITNQRETVVVWERATGRPLHKAIVWQDRRTAEACQRLSAMPGVAEALRRKTGLFIDPYFSATKIAWILDNVPNARTRAMNNELAAGTIDSWLVWRLTAGKTHITDATNASRTGVFNIHTSSWDEELLTIFDVPPNILPEVVDSSGKLAVATALLPGVPICGLAGDQHAALIGQGCVQPGGIKVTLGTGCFLLANTGPVAVESSRGLLTVLAYRIAGRSTYALEGSAFSAGATVKWLRDALKVMSHASATHDMATELADCDGVYFVPAFVGLGAPHWEPNARAVISGITFRTSGAHIARAALESVAYQIHDLCECVAADLPLETLRVDGGMAANDWLMQFTADLLGRVRRPEHLEATARGIAILAAVGLGVLHSVEDAVALWRKDDHEFIAQMDKAERERLLAGWRAAVRRALPGGGNPGSS